MMLWMLILTLFGAMVAWWGENLPPTLKARVLAVQATIAVAFFAFILLTSNPFARLPNPPFDGNDLNPLLQDPGLAFHPPFLYLGYVGLSMAYSFAIAALIEGRVDAAWARWVRPWTLLAWVFLTIGIAFGSIWAYYELGWGGWWFWDPVENVSLHAVAGLLRAPALGDRRREARRAEELDDPARDPCLLLQPRRRLHRPLGRHHLGAFLRQRPRARRLPSPHPRRLHRRQPRRSTPGARRRCGPRPSSPPSAARAASSSTTSSSSSPPSWCSSARCGRSSSRPSPAARSRSAPPFFDLAFTPFMIAIAVVLPVLAILPGSAAASARAALAAPRRPRARAGASASSSGRSRPAARRSRRSAPPSPPG